MLLSFAGGIGCPKSIYFVFLSYSVTVRVNISVVSCMKAPLLSFGAFPCYCFSIS